eukprot:GILI01035104.1.p1 GENE.GILI01035104.1~~GILI01035104.1.p1  ORF type:complete len:237 (+),score=56.36 GILI01035104.1:71-712(+)
MVPAGGNPNPRHVQDGKGTSDWILGPSRPASTATRLILNVYPAAWCGSAQVLDEETLNVPPQVAARGLQDTIWRDYMTRFRDNMRSGSLSIISIILLVCSVFGIPYLIYKWRAGNRFAASWQREFNTVLEPKGMFIKTQKTTVRINDDHEEHVHWMALALTPEESAGLKQEDHVFWFDVLTGKSYEYHECCGWIGACVCCECCFSEKVPDVGV